MTLHFSSNDCGDIVSRNLCVITIGEVARPSAEASVHEAECAHATRDRERKGRSTDQGTLRAMPFSVLPTNTASRLRAAHGHLLLQHRWPARTPQPVAVATAALTRPHEGEEQRPGLVSLGAVGISFTDHPGWYLIWFSVPVSPFQAP